MSKDSSRCWKGEKDTKTYKIRPAVELEIIVEPDDGKEDEFYAFCPKLGGLHVPGRTEEEALNNAKNAARAHIKSLIKHSGRVREEAIDALNRNFGYGLFGRIVLGSMKSVVDAHGPITREFCNSVAKRVTRQTWSELKSILRNSGNLTEGSRPPAYESTKGGKYEH